MTKQTVLQVIPPVWGVDHWILKAAVFPLPGGGPDTRLRIPCRRSVSPRHGGGPWSVSHFSESMRYSPVEGVGQGIGQTLETNVCNSPVWGWAAHSAPRLDLDRFVLMRYSPVLGVDRPRRNRGHRGPSYSPACGGGPKITTSAMIAASRFPRTWGWAAFDGHADHGWVGIPPLVGVDRWVRGRGQHTDSDPPVMGVGRRPASRGWIRSRASPVLGVGHTIIPNPRTAAVLPPLWGWTVQIARNLCDHLRIARYSPFLGVGRGGRAFPAGRRGVPRMGVARQTHYGRG